MDITQTSIRNLLKNIKKARDYIIIRILYETGCEVKELVKIKVSDVLGHRIRINSKEIRFSQISGKLSKDIKQYVKGNKLNKNNFLFSLRKDKPISEKRISQIISEISYDLKIKDMTSKKIRYLHILHSYQNNVLLHDISKQVGIDTYRVFRIIEEYHNGKGISNYNKFLKSIN